MKDNILLLLLLLRFCLSMTWGHTRKVEVQLHTFLTSALDTGQWLTSRPDRFAPGKEPQYPLNWRLNGPQNQSGRFEEKKNYLPLWGLESQTVQNR
jgi:hypothetical protein